MWHSWLILSLLTGLFFGFQSILLKILSNNFKQETILIYLFFIAGILLLPLNFKTALALNFRPFIFSFLISLSLNLIAYTLFLKAIARFPVSIVMPYVGLTPLFLTLTSFFILGEAITSIKFIGILLIVFGAFVLQIPAKSMALKGVARLINFKEKGIWYMITVAFIWSITASVEKIAVKNSSPEFYGSFIHLSLGLGFLLLGYLHRKKSNQVPVKYSLRTNKMTRLLILLGIISAALALCQLTAIKTAYVTYVIAFKRAGVLVSTIYAFLFLNEKNYLKVILGTIFILAGSGILTLV